MTRHKVSPEFVLAALSSLALHAVWLTRDAKASYQPREAKAAEVLFEAEAIPTPPPPPPEEPKTEAPEEKAHPEPAVRNTAPRPQAEKALPAAAQAGKTLTAPETDDGHSDVADFTMVQGTAGVYAGGTTSANGTSANAVHGPVASAPTTAPRGAVAQVAAAGPDLSRGATPTAADWNCSRLFPNDPEAGDQAAVLIAVSVTANGMPRSVTVLRDPGHGFGAAARACAMGQRFNPALNRQGDAIAATTPPITVRFTR